MTIQQDSAAGGTAEPNYGGAAFLENVPCRIEAIGGDSTYRGRMLEAHTSYVVTMQHLDGITPTMRLSVTAGVHSGKTLNIGSIRPVDSEGRSRKLELYCSELAGR